MTDDREPKLCQVCGVVCTFDGWGHVHPNGVGIASCVAVKLLAEREGRPMTDNQERAAEVLNSAGFAGPSDRRRAEAAVAAALDEAEARGREAGYAEATAKSRITCSRFGGCLP